jgi:hypothetical protein
VSKLSDRLWEKHAHPDRHGYKDWMSPEGFEAALAEALKLPTVRALECSDHCQIAVKNLRKVLSK